MPPDRNTSPYSPDFYKEIEKELENMTEENFEDKYEKAVEEMKKRGVIDE